MVQTYRNLFCMLDHQLHCRSIHQLFLCAQLMGLIFCQRSGALVFLGQFCTRLVPFFNLLIVNVLIKLHEQHCFVANSREQVVFTDQVKYIRSPKSQVVLQCSICLAIPGISRPWQKRTISSFVPQQSRKGRSYRRSSYNSARDSISSTLSLSCFKRSSTATVTL